VGYDFSLIKADFLLVDFFVDGVLEKKWCCIDYYPKVPSLFLTQSLKPCLKICLNTVTNIIMGTSKKVGG